MIIIQMIRRLYECSFVAKPSSARMHAAHYVVGLLYYLVTPIAVSIEGWSAVEDRGQSGILLHITANLCIRHILALLLFVWASVQQYKVHVHLASLRPAIPSPGAVSPTPSYNLPRGEWFNYVACPHYLFELVIYISFGALTRWRNLTCILNVVWVVVDLGVAADQQWKWYKHRFGDKLPKGWKRVVPFIF
ncbi:hypothetical protein SpCBS45565_g07007 [Spizellomyces sp. 'palustris']|nr:hypothetical protein SpCBS45565_g07007 [Spizellomyces sp. 'palustris']